MATVTGELNGQPIILDNAASEATLYALLQATMSNSTKKGEADKIQRAYEEALKRTNKEHEKNQKALKDHADVVKKEKDAREDLNKRIREEDEARKKLLSGMMELGNLVGNTIGKGISFAFSTATPKVTDFTNALSGIPIIGPIISAVGTALQGQIDNFRILSTVGADFGVSVLSMTQLALNAGMSLETFTKTIAENGKSLAQLGGSTAAGAKIFRNISTNLQGPFATGLTRLGFTMEETAEYTAGYLAMQTRLGRAQNMTQGELTEGTKAHLLQLDMLSRVYGMTRQEAQKALDAQQQDKRMKLFYAAMGKMGDETKNFMTGLDGANKEFAEGMTELIATGGVPGKLGTMSNSIALNSPRLVELARRLREGTVSQTEANKIIREESELINSKLTPARAKEIMMMKQLGITVYDSEIALVGLNKHGLKAAEAAGAQADALKNGKNAVLSLDRQLLELRNSLMTALMPVFKLFTDTIAGSIGIIKEFAAKLAAGVVEFMAIFNKDGLGAALTYALAGVGTAVGTVLADVLSAAFMQLFNSAPVITGLVLAITALFAAAKVKSAVDILSGGGDDGDRRRTGGKGGKGLGVGLRSTALMAGALTLYDVDQTEKARTAGKITDAQANIDNSQSLGTLAGAGSGAAIGAGFGSAFFGVGAIPGALVGGLLGGLLGSGVGKGLGTMFNSDPKAAAPNTTNTPAATVGPQPSAPNTANTPTVTAATAAQLPSSDELEKISKALASIDFNRLIVDPKVMTSLDTGNVKLRQMRGELSALTTAFKSLNETGLEKITAAIKRLDENFKGVNQNFTSFMDRFQQLDAKTQEQLLTALNDKIDQLNTNVITLRDHAKDTADNTKKGQPVPGRARS